MSEAGVYLTHDEVETLTGYINALIYRHSANGVPEATDEQLAVFSKLEAVVTGPASGGEKHEV